MSIKRSKHPSFLILVVLLFTACKKEPTTWESRLQAPLLKGELKIGELLPADDLSADSADKLSLVREDTLLRLPLDSILELPDTTHTKSYLAPVGGTTVNPGQYLINSTEDRVLQLSKAELKRVILHDGKLHYRITSTLAERTIYEYEIPAATKNGQALRITSSVPAGSQSDPSRTSGVKDLEGYDLDLTGPNGGDVNHFQTVFKVRIDPNGQAINLQNNDSIVVRNRFRGMEPRFAKGYFGNHTVSLPYSESKLDLFDKVRSGSLNIDSVNVRFTLDNGIGMDGRVEISTIRAIGQQGNVDLSHAMIGNPINISRAQYVNNSMQHTVHTEEMTPQNSNVDLFLESLPKKIGHELMLETNPLGDVSNGNDIMLRGHEVHVGMRIALPLSLIANDLTLADTLAWNFGTRKNGKLKEGTLYLRVRNGFPLSASLSVFLQNGKGKRLGSLFEERMMPRASVDPSWVATSKREEKLRISISPSKADLLRQAEKAYVVARFNTPPGAPHIDLYQDYSFEIQASADFKYQNRLK